MNFDQAFELLIGHEGGYANRSPADDPGGETNFGISRRSYPGEDIKGMTLARAKEIYRRDFWGGAAACDALPDGIKFDVFDCTVLCGPHQAALLLQQAAFADADGVIGPHTLLGISYMPIDKLRRRFNGLFLRFLCGRKNWSANAGGWAARVSDNLMRD